MFIRVTVQNMLSHTELTITARQQTFSDQLCYVLCPTTLVK